MTAIENSYWLASLLAQNDGYIVGVFMDRHSLAAGTA